MIAKLAAAVALIVAVLTAPIVAPKDGGAGGYPAPAATNDAPPAYSVGDAPEPWPATATPVMLGIRPCSVFIGDACSQYVTWVPVALAGTPAPCDIWQDRAGIIYCAENFTPAAPSATPQPKGYPAQ